MKERNIFQRLALFLVLTIALSIFSAFPGLTKAEESVNSINTEWTPSATVKNNEGDLPLEELAVKVLSVTDTPEVINADIIAAKKHVNRLWAQETDMNTIVFQNTDGTKSMYYYGIPVKYTDGNGVIRDKSNKVIENQDKATYPDYAYQNKANAIKTLFPQTLSQEEGIVLENTGTKIEMRPYNYTEGENDETSITASSARKEEYVHTDGESVDAVIYDNVFGDSTKLRYTPTFMGFKEDLILEQNIGINQFGFILKAGELQAILQNGCIYLIDPLTGEIEATVSPIYVYDSYSGVKNYENTHDTWNNEIILKELDIEGNYLVTITVDKEFLNDPDTVYPVYVDPTLTFDEAADINDAIIYSGSPSVAHGSNYYNYIGYYNSTYGIGRLLVKFPGMTGDGTYASLLSSQISSVFYNTYTDGTNQSTAIRPYIYTGSTWTESTITCNMASWFGTVTLSDMPAVTVPNSAGNIAFDITAAAKAWKAGTYSASRGLMLKNSNESSSSYYKIFTSTEYGAYYGTHMPYTVVNYYNLPSQVCISETSRTADVNDSFYLTATVLPNDAPQGITWSSSNSSIATVSSGGLVSAIGAGIVTITARSSFYSPVYATCTVTVNNIYGNRAFEYSTGYGQNCMGYAINYHQYITANDLNMTDSELNSIITTSQLLNYIKTKAQTWMSNNSVGYDSLTAYNSSINSINKYRVVLRVGYIDVNDDGDFDYNSGNEGDVYDYHWWYQTNTGQWAEKLAQLESHTISGTSGSTNPYYVTWQNDDLYYNSLCVYYEIDN
jgi:hypothetical protein